MTVLKGDSIPMRLDVCTKSTVSFCGQFYDVHSESAFIHRISAQQGLSQDPSSVSVRTNCMSMTPGSLTSCMLVVGRRGIDIHSIPRR